MSQRNNDKKNDDKKSIVIVGGGSAGTTIARQLSAKLDPSHYSLTLINPLPFFLWRIATARIVVSSEGHIEDTAFIPYEKLFINGNGNFRSGIVTSIEEEHSGHGGAVILSSGDSVRFDFLVLAPGSSWEGPLAFPDSKDAVTQFIATERAKFSKARKIVLAGGGAVGIELAGELKDAYPDKDITIVQGDEALMNSAYPPKFREALEKNVRKRGIKIVFNEYIDEIPAPGSDGVTTRSGRKLAADLVVASRGPRPNTAFISSLGSDVLSEQGFVKVSSTLQLINHPTIFAAGDVLDIKEQKQAAKTANHAAVVSANILSIAAGKPVAKHYTVGSELIIVTNGREGGVGYFGMLWGIVVGDCLARMLKAKDLMVPTARKGVGY